jgi:hypothetical protein
MTKKQATLLILITLHSLGIEEFIEDNIIINNFLKLNQIKEEPTFSKKVEKKLKIKHREQIHKKIKNYLFFLKNPTKISQKISKCYFSFLQYIKKFKDYLQRTIKTFKNNLIGIKILAIKGLLLLDYFLKNYKVI